LEAACRQKRFWQEDGRMEGDSVRTREQRFRLDVEMEAEVWKG
jgi:hypothetical protein